MDDNIEIGLKQLPNRNDHSCFGCGPANTHGLHMKFYTDDVSVFSWLKIPEHMCGWDNIIHGGITSTILDEIMSWSAIYLLKKLILTKSMNIEFLKPIYVGTELKTEGIVFEQKSDREAIMEGMIFNSKDVLCARSKGVYKLLKPEVAIKLNMMSKEALKDFEPILKA